MKVLTELQHKALAFVGAANASGHAPTGQELERWLVNPEPRRTGGSFEQLSGISTRKVAGAMGPLLGKTELTAEHFAYLGWVGDATSLTLTPLGRALLHSAEVEDSSQPTVLILDNEDPLAYIQLLGMLSELSGVLLVDPYLDARELSDLMNFTSVERVLMGHKDKGKLNRVTTLLTKTVDPSVAVRCCKGLHDRMIIDGGGRVWVIGASMNTVSNQSSITTLAPMPDEAAQTLSAWAERKWKDASVLPESAPEMPLP